MSADLEAPTKFDPNNDPAKLAKIGAFVTRKLENNPLVQRIEVPDLQVYVYQGFLGKRDCGILISKIDADAVPSTLYKGTEQAGFRTSYSCHLNRWDPDITRVEARMSDTLGIDNNWAETMQGQRYQVGQEFKAHHDFFHPGQSYWDHEGPRGGQRSWTAMIFLNEPEEGGATEFPHIGIGVRPQAVLVVPETVIDQIAGGTLVRLRSRTVYYLLRRMQQAVRRPGITRPGDRD